MDMSVEFLELIFNATEGKGIVLLGDESAFLNSFDNVSRISVSADGNNRYVFSTDTDGIMCDMILSYDEDYENSFVKINYEEEIENFEFITMLVEMIVRHNAVFRLKRTKVLNPNERHTSVSEEDAEESEFDTEWI